MSAAEQVVLEAEATTVIIPAMRIYAAAERWLGELGSQNRRPRTLASYGRLIHGLGDMYPHHDLHEVTTDMVRRYRDTIVMRNGRPLDPDTISQRIGILKRFFAWCRTEGYLVTDPAERLKAPTRKNPLKNDKIVVVSSAETARMLEVARADLGCQVTPQDRYRKLLAVGVLAYTGSRRHATAQAKISDCDLLATPPTITFYEKGGRTIRKPIPAKLAEIIREAWLAGVWDDDPRNPDGYLVPPISTPRGRKGTNERDDRIVYFLVKEVATAAGVKAHVHAIRASFAVYFLETYPTEIYALKDHMDHAALATTEIYLRRLNRQKGMAVNEDMDWGEAEAVAAADPEPVAGGRS